MCCERVVQLSLFLVHNIKNGPGTLSVISTVILEDVTSLVGFYVCARAPPHPTTTAGISTNICIQIKLFLMNTIKLATIALKSTQTALYKYVRIYRH